MQSETNVGGLTTWLIEEVEWSGRPCNNVDRVTGTCNGGSNRENNTVYGPRWNAWLQLLDYVKNYPGGVIMTMGEVALAKGFDNAPTVANPNQADSNHNGIGDVIDGASLTAAAANLSRNQAGTLSATLTNGASQPIAGQNVTFLFDADGDGTNESYPATTLSNGAASVSVTPTRAVGATLKKADGVSLAGKSVQFFVQERVKNQLVYTLVGTAQTNANGVAALEIPSQHVSSTKRAIRATFNGDGSFLNSVANAFAYRK